MMRKRWARHTAYMGDIIDEYILSAGMCETWEALDRARSIWLRTGSGSGPFEHGNKAPDCTKGRKNTEYMCEY
jgi:hypothetical protein